METFLVVELRQSTSTSNKIVATMATPLSRTQPPSKGESLGFTDHAATAGN